MSTEHSLALQRRTVIGKKVKYLRNEGLLPITVYGKGVEPVSVQVDERAFFQVYRKVGQSSLIELTIPGLPMQSAFVQDIQRHPVSRRIIHADLRVVDLKVEMTTDVPIHLVGISPLVEKDDAVLNPSLQAITVRALPANVPSQIEVDVSVLDSLDKSIHVADLPRGDDYEILTDDEEVIVTLTQTRMAAEIEEEEAEEEEGQPELIRREEEEEGSAEEES